MNSFKVFSSVYTITVNNKSTITKTTNIFFENSKLCSAGEYILTKVWFLFPLETSCMLLCSCGISQGEIISVNWLLCYRFFRVDFSSRKMFMKNVARFFPFFSSFFPLHFHISFEFFSFMISDFFPLRG